MSEKVTLERLLDLLPAYDFFGKIEIKKEDKEFVFDGKVSEIPYKNIKKFEDYVVCEIRSGFLSVSISSPDDEEVEND